ncbi:MAG: nucleotidyltransferase family protein [Gammaproteobacteria bacterium]|nr:nucleotidyltransferase family protein [Gammaproteobacteria bacterium]
MHVIILSAGRGERLRPITDTIPKPLLEVGGEALIDRHIRRLADAGFKDIVINLSWLGEQIRTHVGDGSRYGVRVQYSDEGDTGLETAGGIRKAYDLLNDDSDDSQFVIVNGDLWTDYDFLQLKPLPAEQQAHLVMVPNPDFLPRGDFEIHDGQISYPDPQTGNETYTYSGISVFRLSLFTDLPKGESLPLRAVLQPIIESGQVTGEVFTGSWFNIGSENILNAARESATEKNSDSKNEQPSNTVASAEG